MKIKNYTFFLTVVLLLTAVAAHALTPSYDNTYTTGSTQLALDSDNYSTLSFTSTQGYSSAIPNLNVTDLKNSLAIVGEIKLTSPSSGQFITDTDYLITQNLKPGNNSPDLTTYLSSLHLADSSSGINQGLYIDRDSFTFKTASLTGAVAPKPATLALVAAGLIGIPFARRFRKHIR